MSIETSGDRINWWEQNEAATDEKGRITVPTALRSVLPARFVIARAPDHGLVIYTQSAWNEVEIRLSQPDQNEHYLFLRRFLGGRSEVSVDTQNRLTIPQHLREYANITTNNSVTFLGVGDRIEIWRTEKWKEISERFDEKSFITSAIGIGLMQPSTSPVA